MKVKLHMCQSVGAFDRVGWGNLGIVFVLLSRQNAKLIPNGKLPAPMPQMVPSSTVPVPFLDELSLKCMPQSYFYTKA